MTDPLLCPRIPLNLCDITDYCSLGGSTTDAEAKLAILDDYICRIDAATLYRPATKEFIRYFDVEQSIDILKSYYSIDNFFRCMTQGFLSFISIMHLSLTDEYFLLIELKCYINERRTAIIKNSRTNTLLMLEQYKNHFSFNPPTIPRIEMLHNDHKFLRPDFFVPESILYIDSEHFFTVNDAIICTNYLIRHIKDTHMQDVDLDVYSFFENFRNLMFNNQNDSIIPEVVERACQYVFSLSHTHNIVLNDKDCPCRYAAFVRALACTYKNNLSQ